MAELLTIDDVVDRLHEAAGTKRLADRMARLLILSDSFASLNGAPMAIALWFADPECSKENSMELIRQFGESCSAQLDENWDALAVSHGKLASGEARRIPLGTLRSRVIGQVASIAETDAADITEDRTVDDLDIDEEVLAISLESEFGIAGLGHDWDGATSMGHIIADVDAKVEGYI